MQDANPPEARPQGCTFVNQYVVVKTLGQGAYSRVKLALDTGDQRLVALKLLRRRPPRPALPTLLRFTICSIVIKAKAHCIGHARLACSLDISHTCD